MSTNPIRDHRAFFGVISVPKTKPHPSVMNIVRVESLDLPALQVYRTLRRPTDHHRQGIFVAEGEKVVRRMMASDITAESVLLTPEWLDEFSPLLAHRAIDVYVAPKRLVESIVGFHLHQGIMAVGRMPEEPSLPRLLETLPRPLLLAAIDGLTNAENIGVLVRNCAAFGVQAILVGETSSSPYLRRAVRNSMGAVFRLPVVHSERLTGSLATIRELTGARIIAAHPSGTRTLDEADVSGDCCIVFGSEGEGISPDVLNQCDEALSVSMHNGVDSLNVGSASAVFLYEATRKRERVRA